MERYKPALLRKKPPLVREIKYAIGVEHAIYFNNQFENDIPIFSKRGIKE